MSANVETNERPDYDEVIQKIADYVLDYEIVSETAWAQGLENPVVPLSGGATGFPHD